MDYLLSLCLNNPNKVDIFCYYIVNSRLMYVGVVSSDRYALVRVLSDNLDEVVYRCDTLGELDYYVYREFSPVISQSMNTEIIDDRESRIVTLVTDTVNPKTIKKKPTTERTVIERRSTGQKRLF